MGNTADFVFGFGILVPQIIAYAAQQNSVDLLTILYNECKEKGFVFKEDEGYRQEPIFIGEVHLRFGSQCDDTNSSITFRRSNRVVSFLDKIKILVEPYIQPALDIINDDITYRKWCNRYQQSPSCKTIHIKEVTNTLTSKWCCVSYH